VTKEGREEEYLELMLLLVMLHLLVFVSSKRTCKER
jgi:hypothetical protein